MKEKSFTITAATAQMSADTSGRVRAAFTVTNNSTSLLRGAVNVRSLGETQPEWLKVAGECERQFAPKETRQFEVDVAIPTSAKAGSWPFRLDACSTDSPDDDYTQGPVVAVVTTRAETPPPVKKPFPWWIVFVSLGVLLAVTLSILALRPKVPEEFFLVGHIEHADRAAQRLKVLGFKTEFFGVPTEHQRVLVVVALTDGAMPATREGLIRLKEQKHGKLGLFFVNGSQMNDQELRELVKLEMEQLLKSCEFKPEEVPRLYDDVRDDVLKAKLLEL